MSGIRDILVMSFLPWLLLCFLPHVAGTATTITTELRPGWSATPLHLEAAEVMWDFGQQVYWQFVEQFVEPLTNAPTDKELYERSLALAKELLPEDAQGRFQMLLDARAKSPMIELHRQVLANDVMATTATCDTFLVTGSEILCDVSDIATQIDALKTAPRLEEVDHTFGSPASAPHFVLYADIAAEQFRSVFNVLKQLSLSTSLSFSLRYNVNAAANTASAMQIGGFGVELAVKKTDYIVMDDSQIDDGGEEASLSNPDEDEVENDVIGGISFTTLKALYPNQTEDLEAFRAHMISKASTIATLKAWEVQDISMQASQYIANSENPLNAFVQLTQDFPSAVQHVVNVKVDKTFGSEVRKLHRKAEAIGVSAGSNIMAINNVLVETDRMDLFRVIDLVNREAGSLALLSQLGLTAADIAQMFDVLAESSLPSGRQIDVRGSGVFYLNDLEKDQRYSSWQSSLMSILRQSMPGQPHRLRKNLFTVTAVLDLSVAASYSVLSAFCDIIADKFPIRMGVILVSQQGQTAISNRPRKYSSSSSLSNIPDMSTSPSLEVVLGRLFYHLAKTGFAVDQFLDIVDAAGGPTQVTMESLEEAVTKAYSTEIWSSLSGAETKYDSRRIKSEVTAFKLGFNAKQSPQLFINGHPVDTGSYSDLQSLFLGVMNEHILEIQRDVYYRKISERDDILDALLKKDGVQPSNVPAWMAQPSSQDALSSLDRDSQYSYWMQRIFTAKSTKSKSETFVLFTDLNTRAGQLSLFEGARRLFSNQHGQVGVVHVPSSSTGGDDGACQIADLITAAFNTLPSGQHHKSLGSILSRALFNGTCDVDELLADVKEKYVSDIKAAIGTVLPADTALVNALNVVPGVTAVLVNKFLYMAPGAVALRAEDFMYWEKRMSKVFHSRSISNIVQKSDAISQESEARVTSACTAWLARSLVATKGRVSMSQERRLRSSLLKDMTTKASFEFDNTKPDSTALPIQVTVLVDPATEEAQRIAPILAYLFKMTQVAGRVLFNATPKLSEQPVKRFYRMAEPRVAFGDDGQAVAGPRVVFSNMPTAPLLTLGMDTPASWMVQSVSSKYDLDNIHLQSSKSKVSATFQLEYLTVEGSASDESRKPVAGLQLELASAKGGVEFDTIVMANLGYFQLKATPGLWSLQLRQGRSADIFNVNELTGGSPINDVSGSVAVKSFTGTMASLRLAHREGMEDEQLLDSQATAATTASNDASLETINVLSIASGHLYERFLKIMMLSVLRNTKNPVKFWFLDTSMSPQMKKMLPFFAEKYGFDYKLVSYNWPQWLNKPKEKMRLIWAYKILFLDVLFPLDVKKIIFVDADQIVRADLRELVELDLQGAPYGYTPFCDSREGMDGFRFWKQGYWANHLMGRPYHISALYVVDLVRFRQFAAGDRLREQYQMLSQDPNSLSNLDQDLPNNMVHQVPIFSLPQEWLWCESWCDENSKKTAKTIDLCNNPKTKEPKLEAAVRIVPEWTELDEEAKAVTLEFLRGAKMPSDDVSSSKAGSHKDEL
eukprot:m.306561 g.306561  ORF g.306561 m.306561 type:complete len:1519 (-) comp15924_c0_seq3:278-4834(-)